MGSGSTAFNPKLILYQIVALQSFFYLTLGALLSVFHGERASTEGVG